MGTDERAWRCPDCERLMPQVRGQVGSTCGGEYPAHHDRRDMELVEVVPKARLAEIERQRDELRRQLEDPSEWCCQQCKRDATAERTRADGLERERDHWKANHDSQVKIKQKVQGWCEEERAHADYLADIIERMSRGHVDQMAAEALAHHHERRERDG